jgi:hypothetical protein
VPGDAARPCLIVNPRSFRAARRGLARRASQLARQHGIEVIEAGDLDQFRTVLERLRARSQSQIWLLSGDGTIQAFAEFLAGLPAGEWSPALLLLGGGRANIIPRDCGGYPAMRKLAAALAALRANQPLREELLPTLRVSQDGVRTRHGFMIAGAVIHEGVRLCSEHRARGTGWLNRSWIADPYTLLKLAVQVWLGRSPLPPYETLHVSMSPGEQLHAPVRILIGSTLQLRDGLYNPFAERGRGSLRLTAVTATATHFWRHLPGVFTGRFSDAMRLSHGYMSGRCESAEVLGMSAYSIDGESFTCDPARPVRLSAGVALRVLRP